MIRGYDYSLENQSQVPIKIKVYGQAKNEKNYCEEHEILPGEKAIYDKKISYEDYETLPVMDIFVTDGSRRCLTDSLMLVNAGVSYRGFLPYETDTLFYGDDDVSVKYTKHIVNDSILEYAVPCGD
ncbi:MAG: hypothetical protein HUK20_03730 [Fibrobacter sp.]|nr:hypothetical protein [Fibrobacter sp.]